MVSNIDTIERAELHVIGTRFLANCEDVHFRQTILIDSPNLLGHRRAMDGAINKAIRKQAAKLFNRKPDGLAMTMLMGALSQAALSIAENGASSDDYRKICDLVDFHFQSKAD